MVCNSAISSSSPTPGTWASYPHRREAEVSSCHICQRRARRGRRGWSDQCSRSWGQLRSWRRPPGGPYPPPPHWACHTSCSPDSDTPRPGRDSGGWSKPSWERKMDFMTWLMRQPDIQSKSLPHFNVLFSSFLADIRNRNIVGSKINHFFNFPMTILSILSKNWHINNNYKRTELKPHCEIERELESNRLLYDMIFMQSKRRRKQVIISAYIITFYTSVSIST